MSFDPAGRTWRNELPKGAEGRGGETGNVRDVELKTHYFALADAEGLVRHNRRHLCMWYHYALAPWDGKVYALICGRVLCYDPRERTWRDTQAPPGPMPLTQHHREGLSWSALCADPAGAVFGLWEPHGTPGARLVNEPGTWNFSELDTHDREGAVAFYGAVFGWELSGFGDDEGRGSGLWRMPGYGDFLAERDPTVRERQADVGAPEGFEDAVAWLVPSSDGETPAHWSITFAVDDADAAADRATGLGGKVLVPPMDAPWVRMTVISDPQGAVFTASAFVPPTT